MNIVVDINHPAHVHFFKYFIREMQSRGHTVRVTASDKDVACALLDEYGLPYRRMGNYGRSAWQKGLNVGRMDWRMVTATRNFRPDIFFGLASVRAAHAAFLMRRPCVNFDDTENGVAELRLYLPFVTRVCTPACYQKDLGPKQVRYEGYHELAYLHPNYFRPDPSVKTELGVGENERFVILRFVSWEAVHDVGHRGLTAEMKRRAVEEFSRYARVFITAENPLPPDLSAYRLPIAPHRVHHALYYADLLYGESATMASECAVLGTPAIYIDEVGRGYTREQERVYQAVLNFKESPSEQERSIREGMKILESADSKARWREKAAGILRDKIDVTAWMLELAQDMKGSVCAG